MKSKESVDLFQSYQKSTHKREPSKAILCYSCFCSSSEHLLSKIGPEEIFHFLEGTTAGRARSTRRIRYAKLKAFFNFVINRCVFEIRNPCNELLVSRAFKGAKPVLAEDSGEGTLDELVYNTQSLRDRLLLELQARCGLRIGEALTIRVSDICERRILLREPKSGKEAEVAYMPEAFAKRISDYIRDENLSAEDRLFPICYSTARSTMSSSYGTLLILVPSCPFSPLLSSQLLTSPTGKRGWTHKYQLRWLA